MVKYKEFILPIYDRDDFFQKQIVLRFYERSIMKNKKRYYYPSWIIIERQRATEKDKWENEIVYKELCDDVLSLGDVEYILNFIENKENEFDTYEIIGNNQGTVWELIFHEGDSRYQIPDKWEIRVWQTENHRGYYFIINQDQVKLLRSTLKEYLSKMQLK